MGEPQPPPARVDDVIEHGQPIPGNVVRLHDGDGDHWAWVEAVDAFRCMTDTTAWALLRDGSARYDYDGERSDVPLHWWPLTVVEVDPEPQHADSLRCLTCSSPQPSMHPAVGGGGEVTALCPDSFHVIDPVELRGEVDRLTMSIKSQIAAKESAYAALESIKDVVTRPLCRLLPGVRSNEDIVPAVQSLLLNERAARHALDRPLIEAFNELASPTEPQPVVLRLPEVPEGTVALIGVRSGARRESPGLAPNGSQYWCGKDGYVQQLGSVLDDEPDGVTVEFAPPREPRTWPKLDGPPADVLRVRGASGAIWTRRATDEGAWHNEDWSLVRSWGALALEDGPLTEVPL